MRSRRTLCAAAFAVALTAVAPATAQSPKPPKSVLFGGGVIGTQRDPQHLDVQYTQVRIAKDAKTLTFFGDYREMCDGGLIAGSSIAAKNVTIRKDLSFSGKAAANGGGPGLTQTGGVTFSGRFVAPGVVRGTASATADLVFADGSPTQHCVKNKIRFTAVVPGAPATSGAPKGGASYFGNTSDTLPTLLRLKQNGKDVLQAALEFGPHCDVAKNTTPLTNETMFGNLIKATKNGFKGHEDYTSTQYVPGQEWRFHVDLTATYGFPMRGRWTIRMEVIDVATGQQVDTCKSDTPFTAARSLA